MNSEFANYFRVPADFDRFEVAGQLSAPPGFFSYAGATCFGRRSNAAESVAAAAVRLPFDLQEVVLNLQHERYCSPIDEKKGITVASLVRATYYLFRPLLPVAVRKHLQKAHLKGWDEIPFPQWPVDFSVDTLMRRALMLSMQRHGVERAPFIWFWPNGARACGILTHDVEAPGGYAFCGELMTMNEAEGFKAAFEIVPELRYDRPGALCAAVRERGHEVNVHDLNHDGHLFEKRTTFLERVKKINEYGKEFGAEGFRAAAMYRNQSWFDSLQFSYDLSVPNVAHLEPQRGGCCTVMPYFVAGMVELPLTTIQDYSLFNIVGDYSIDIWKRQIALILERNGLITLLTHPDYLIEKRARAVYVELLKHVRRICIDQNVWFPLPREVARWWRSRSRMTLVQDGGRWRVNGPDSDRARVAFAVVRNGSLAYELES